MAKKKNPKWAAAMKKAAKMPGSNKPGALAKRASRIYKGTATKKKSSAKKPSAKKKSTSKAVKKKSYSNPGNPGKKRGNTMKRLVSPKTVRMVSDTGFVAGGLVGTTLAMKKIPIFDKWKWWQKSLAQGVVGIIGMAAFIKFKWLFLLFSGSLTGAIATALLEVIPERLKGRTFTDSELKKLKEGIRQHNSGSLGVPESYAKKRGLGVPITNNLNVMGSIYNSKQRASH